MDWKDIAPGHLLPYLQFQAKFLWEKNELSQVVLTMHRPSVIIEGSKAEIEETLKWLDSYFRGEDYPLALKKARSAFQQEVCEAMREIEFGKTLSYSDLAKFIGNERAVRAVGSACGRNHLPLVVPCHRIIAKNGSIGGFSLDMSIKLNLLQLEEEVVLFSKST
jgi:O-6-methylguanine DNA methyltransferase